MRKILKRLLNYKKTKKMKGKQVKLCPTPVGKPMSNNAYLSTNGVYTIGERYTTNKQSWLIFDSAGNNCGWVYEWEISDYCITVEDLRNLHVDKYNEAKELQAKIDWMEETGVEKFDEDEYKVYKTLKLLEDKELSMIEKSKLITKLIR